MDTHDEDIVLQVQQTLILDEITKIASFQPENKDPDRGKYLISPDSDKLIFETIGQRRIKDCQLNSKNLSGMHVSVGQLVSN